jgi:Transposase
MSDVALPGSHYTHRVVAVAVRLVVEDGLPYRAASWHLWRDHRVFVPFATIQNWVEARGKKAAGRMASDYLAWALADFSGDIAADELYDGPFCVLSIVDNRRFKRLVYDVLDHHPTHEDIRGFFGRLKAALDAHSLTMRGITTDASPLYPVPIAAIFGPVSHQIGEFHTVAEITKAVLSAVARVRKALAAQLPKLPRGRPAAKAAKQIAQAKNSLQQKVTDLFDHRSLFVQHYLTPAARKTLARISRGHRQLRVLREIMDEVYRLFDRRCRSESALQKLAKLRRRVCRFKKVGKALQKLFSPNLEKALTFLNDKLLPSTSNAVERGNRRHRKMQKMVYRVRTQEHISNRIALDMLRDAQTEGRNHTTQPLHLARVGS